MIKYKYLVMMLIMAVVLGTNISASPLKYETILSAKGVLLYNKKYIAPDTTTVIIEEWLIDRKKNSPRIIVHIMDLKKRVKIASLIFDNENGEGYMEGGSFVWLPSSEAFIYSLTGAPNTLYKWSMSTKESKEFLVRGGGISHISISPDGDNMLFLEYADKESPKLVLFNLKNKLITVLDEDVDSVAPVWKGNNHLLYSKYNAIYSCNVMKCNMSAVARPLDDSQILNISGVFSDYVIIVGVANAGNRSNVKGCNNNVQFCASDNVFVYLLEDKKYKKIIEYNTSLPGIGVSNRHLIFPLVLEGGLSVIIKYDYINKMLIPVVLDPGLYDLPVFVNKFNTIMLRKGKNEIILTTVSLLP